MPPVPPTVPTTSTTLIDYSTVPLAAVETQDHHDRQPGPGPGPPVGHGRGARWSRARGDRARGAAAGRLGGLPGRRRHRRRGQVADRTAGRRPVAGARVEGARPRRRRPETVFLEAAQTKSLAARARPLRGTGGHRRRSRRTRRSSAARPTSSWPSTSASVDAEGVVRSTPIPNLPVQLFAPNWYIASANPLPTDADGRVTWLVGCALPGPSGHVRRASHRRAPQRRLELAPCAEPPPPPTVQPA